MRNHVVQSRVGVLRLLYTDNLHLVELMEAVEPADIFSIRAGLTAEARGVCRHLNREVVVAENHVTIDVGHRNLGGRYEIVIVDCRVVHLPFLVRKLACTEA